MSTDVEPAAVQSTITMMPAGNDRLSCTVYGCKRSYTDVEALKSHVNDHQIPAESIPGKVFLCSIVGCDGSFSNMQQLMEHMRVHYKPNVYFICESCRAKLRSYRTLLKHLQTCAKVAKSKAARAGAPTEQEAEPEPQVPTSATDTLETSELEQMETETTPPSVEHPTAMGHSPNSIFSFSPMEAPVQSPNVPQTSPSQPLSSPSPQSAAASSNAVWRKNQDAPGPQLHRWNSPPSSHTISRGTVQASPSAAVYYGSTPGGATTVSSVATALPTARR